MRRSCKLFILFFLIAFLAVPVFAQEGADEPTVAVAEEEVLFSDEGVITGDVVSLDATSGTITVEADGKSRTFSVVDGETILWRGIEDIEIADIKTGEEAEVGYYTDESGDFVASWVDVLVEDEEVVPLEVEEETAQE